MSAAISIAKPSALADGELVQSALAGRETSFEELVRRYQRPIAAYVYRMVGDYDSALDLTQEVFIKVYHSLTTGIDAERREISIESRRLTPEQESERKEQRSEIESVVQWLPAAYRDP